MKCSVCGTESKGDARFCSGCGATLIVPTYDKTMLLDVRAFRAAQAGEIPVVQSPRPAPAVAPAPPAPPTRSNKVGLVLVVVALAVVVWLLYQLVTSFGALSTFLAPRTAPPPSSPPERVLPAPPRAAVTPVPAKVEPAAPPTVPAAAAAAAKPEPTVNEPKIVPVAPKGAPRAPKPAPAPSPSTALPDDAGVSREASAPPRSVAPVAASPPSVDAPVPAPAAAPLRQDRLQELDTALAGCARENFFGRVVCEQRARLQYCNGYWGKVAQCPDSQGPAPGK